MPLPLIPILGSILGLSGLGTLVWYYSKSQSEQKRLDAKAEEIAFRLYDKQVKDLSLGQAKSVYDKVKKLS